MESRQPFAPLLTQLRTRLVFLHHRRTGGKSELPAARLIGARRISSSILLANLRGARALDPEMLWHRDGLGFWRASYCGNRLTAYLEKPEEFIFNGSGLADQDRPRDRAVELFAQRQHQVGICLPVRRRLRSAHRSGKVVANAYSGVALGSTLPNIIGPRKVPAPRHCCSFEDRQRVSTSQRCSLPLCRAAAEAFDAAGPTHGLVRAPRRAGGADGTCGAAHLPPRNRRRPVRVHAPSGCAALSKWRTRSMSCRLPVLSPHFRAA